MTRERLDATMRQRMPAVYGRTSVSEPSRFLEEVPSENADWVGRQAQGASGFGDTSFDEGSSYSTRGYGSYGQGAARYDSVMQRRPKSQASQKLAAQKPAASRAAASSFPPATRSTTRRSVTDWSSPSPLWAAMRCLRWRLIPLAPKKLMLKNGGVHITVRIAPHRGGMRQGGCSLSSEREHPPYTPQERKDEGPSPSTPHIGSFNLEELHALRNVGAVYMASP